MPSIEVPRGTPRRIALIGATGFVGSAFAKELTSRGYEVLAIGRRNCDVYDAESLLSCLQDAAPEFLINCAGYTGKPNVDACESDKAACLAANAVLPGVLARACETLDLPWGHVSSGCIYTGKKPDGTGFTESDPPNFSFRQNNCSFYSGTKALGEEVLQRPRGLAHIAESSEQHVPLNSSRGLAHFAESSEQNVPVPLSSDGDESRRGLAHFAESSEQNVPVPLSSDGDESRRGLAHVAESVEQTVPDPFSADGDNISKCYLWRLRIPFSNVDSPRNYLSKLLNYQRLLNAENSLSNLPEFVAAALDSFEKQIPYGIYNLTNPGSVTTRQVVELIKQAGITNRKFDFFESEAEFMQTAAKTPRSNCVLDTTKAREAGLVMSDIETAIRGALSSWSGQQTLPLA